MKRDLKDKVVIVTGASSGIGESCALQFAKRGAKLVLVSRNQQKLQRLADKIGGVDVMVVPTDVSSKEDVDQMVGQVIDRFQRIDVLINNAGVGIKGSVITTPLEDYDKVVQTNLYGVLYGVRAVYPHMKQQGQGVIVNVSSVAGFKGFYDSGLYSSTKFAVNGMTESLGEEARKDNIDVILICPGKVETEFERNVVYRDEPICNRRSGVSADVVAESIVNAVQRNKKMVVVGKKCTPMYLLNRLSPKLTNYIIRYIY